MSKPAGGSIFDSAFPSSDVDKMSSRNWWRNVKSVSSGAAALRYLNPFH